MLPETTEEATLLTILLDDDETCEMHFIGRLFAIREAERAATKGFWKIDSHVFVPAHRIRQITLSPEL